MVAALPAMPPSPPYVPPDSDVALGAAESVRLAVPILGRVYQAVASFVRR
jgi:hypothetical protein